MIDVSGSGARTKQDAQGAWESAAFPWTDAAFRPPEVDDVVVYEFDVREWRAR